MNRFLYDYNFRYRFARHLTFFLLTVIAFAVILFVKNSNGNFLQTFGITFVNALFFFSYAYLTIFLLIPEFLLTKKIIWFIILFLLVGIGLSAIKLVVSDHIFYSDISPENIERFGIMSLRFIVVNTKDMTFIVALFFIAKYVKDYLYAEKLRKVLEIQAKEAQRKLFQVQFDPHFLFNTINNLYALSLLNSLKTKQVIARIKVVLNYIIEEIQKKYVDLKQEISLAESYIELEKLRYGNRLSIDFIIEGDVENYRIPPMILFILIENCFKHGSSMDAGTPWIKIKVKTSDGIIFLSTENSKPKTKSGSKGNDKTKHHLVHLRKRLELIYAPQGYELKIFDSVNKYKVEIEIKEKIDFR